MTLLSKIPGISFIKDNVRLVIEYLLIGVIVTLACVVVTLWYKQRNTEVDLVNAKSQLTTMNTRLGLAEFATIEQNLSIQELKAQRERDAAAMSGLMTDFETLRDGAMDMSQRLQELGESNEETRNYINGVLPPDVKCLLERTCKAGGDGNKTGASPSKG
ncbi:lysin B [Pseudomonas phage MiCath]|uniref:Lysin B n=1 Tax=Pseudomonas phage MiCath TaxID=3003729 RepID=A0AAE9VFH3_9CAUD|nr:lysin B [Pseudomonas phage MiCath]WAX22358.1 lysin B [Pseudomonas phage MiCath]